MYTVGLRLYSLLMRKAIIIHTSFLVTELLLF